MKNIWIINFFAGSPESGWGERHYFMSKEWIKSGYNVSILSSTYNHMFSHYANDDRLFNVESVDGTTFCWIRTPRYNAKSVMRFYSMIVFGIRAFFAPIKKIGKPDIILVSSMPIFSSLTGWLLKKRYKAEKFIFEIRDIWPLSAQMMLGYSQFHPFIMLMSWFELIGYKKSDYIVTLLPNAGKHINPISGNPEKLKYIPNGISDELLKNEQLPLSISEIIPKDKFIIGYTGTIGLANALEYLIEAACMLSSNTELFFILVGDGYLKEDLMKKTEYLNNVMYVPKIKKAYIQSMISYFDICFIGRNNIPLFNYGVSSNKYFDYMLASKPILVSSNRIKDPVELSGCGIIVEPDSSKAIVDGILTLYTMTKEERLKIGKSGEEFVKKYHNMSFLSNEYEKLFG